MVVVSVDREAAGFVAMAIREYRVRARRDGWTIPVGVNELEATFLANARLVTARPTEDTDGQSVLRIDRPESTAHDVEMKLTLTLAEVARMLSISTKTVQRLVASGAFPSVMVGGSVRVRRGDLDEYVNGLGHRSMRETIETKESA